MGNGKRSAGDDIGLIGQGSESGRAGQSRTPLRHIAARAHAIPSTFVLRQKTARSGRNTLRETPEQPGIRISAAVPWHTHRGGLRHLMLYPRPSMQASTARLKMPASFIAEGWVVAQRLHSWRSASVCAADWPLRG